MPLLEEIMNASRVEMPAAQPQMPLPQTSGLLETLRPQESAPRPGPNPRNQALKEVFSDVMYTLAQTLAAGASAPGQRGTQAGLAAAIAGPMQRRTMLAEQEIEKQKAAQAQQKLEADLEQSKLAAEKTRKEIEQFGIKEITRADGSKFMMKMDPVTYEPTNLGELSEPTEVKPAPQIPGRDIPFPDDVQAQRTKDADDAAARTRETQQAQQTFTAGENQKNRDAAATRAQTAADARIAAVSAAGLSGELNSKQMSSALQLANSLKAHPAYTDMLDIATGISGVESGLSQKSGLGDITAINSFQRMVDPGATVRSEDVGLIRAASAILDRVFSEYPIEKLRAGAVLPAATREELRKTAVDLYERRAKNYNDMVGTQYKGLAKAGGIPFEYVGADFASRNAPAKAVAATAPSGVDQAIWDAMTPEERALWQN